MQPGGAAIFSASGGHPEPATLMHPRTVGWFGTTAVAMGGSDQSLFLLGALLVGQGTTSCLSS